MASFQILHFRSTTIARTAPTRPGVTPHVKATNSSTSLCTGPVLSPRQRMATSPFHMPLCKDLDLVLIVSYVSTLLVLFVGALLCFCVIFFLRLPNAKFQAFIIVHVIRSYSTELERERERERERENFQVIM